MFRNLIEAQITNLGSEIINKWLDNGKAPKLLLKSFEDYMEIQGHNNPNLETDCYIDKKSILEVDPKIIRPNFTVEELKDNLKQIFDKCIRSDDIEKSNSIKNEICISYLEKAKSELLDLRDIDDDIHKVHLDVKKGTEEVLLAIKNSGKKNIIQNSEYEKNTNEAWLDIIYQWCKYADIENWKIWTSFIFSAGQPRIYINDYRRLEELRLWLLSRVWPEEFQELRKSMLNFQSVLNDFLNVFTKHSEHTEQMYKVEKFYHIDHWDDSLYRKLLKEYNEHVNLIQDLALELTRAANHICDLFRKFIDPKFRFKEGKLVVEAGPFENFDFMTYRPEYTDENNCVYEGLELFMEQRKTRDFCFASKEE